MLFRSRRQTTTRAHVQHITLTRATLLQGRDRRQTVQQVLVQHLIKVSNSGQVVHLVPLVQQAQVIQQLLLLVWGQGQPQRLQTRSQALRQPSCRQAAAPVLSGVLPRARRK